MLNIGNLLDTAKASAGLKSDQALVRKLNAHPRAAHDWRSGHCLPTPEKLVQLCDLANADKALWLLWLQSRKTDGEARAVFTSLLMERSAFHNNIAAQ